MSSFQDIEIFQNKNWENIDCNEEERELEEALSFSDLPITTISVENEENEAKLEEKPRNEEDNLDFDFDFGSLVGSMSALDGEMCTADEVFSGGQILPYRNSVSSMTELRSFSKSESIDYSGFRSRSNSSRSSSIRSHYSTTSSSGSSNCSNNTAISAKTIPMVSKTKVLNQFHSYPSPKPQILGSCTRISTNTSPIGKKSKMWEVLKLGLVRTPEIELQDLKTRHNRTNNFGKSLTFPRNNSTSSNSSSNSNNKAGNNNNNNNNNDRARKSCSNEGNKISDFVLEMQKRKSRQLLENKIGNKNGGFFKSCKCSIGAIDPLPTRPNYYGDKQGKTQQKSSENQVLKEEKKDEQQQEHKRNNQIQQEKEKQAMSSNHQQHRTFEWLKNLSHASVLNS